LVVFWKNYTEKVSHGLIQHFAKQSKSINALKYDYTKISIALLVILHRNYDIIFLCIP